MTAIDGYKLATDLYEHACRVALTGQHAAFRANEAMVVTNDLDRLTSILDDLDVWARQMHDFNRALQNMRLWVASERERLGV